MFQGKGECHLSSGNRLQEGQSCDPICGWNLEVRSGNLSWIKSISHHWSFCWKELRADACADHWIPLRLACDQV